MDFRLLGPLEVVGDGGDTLDLGKGRQRALMALLILHADEPVSRDRLIEALWGEDAPPTAHKVLQNQVSALRRALGADGRLQTEGGGYRLRVGPGERDVDRFDALVARGRDLLAADPEAAAACLQEALGLWRGPPLADLAYEGFAQSHLARLEEARWSAFEARMEAELDLGHHAQVVAVLEAAVHEQPLREHLHTQLMLALYRDGRQADALAAYRRARRTLVEEIGIEPGSELRALNEAILAQDPALARHLAAGAADASARWTAKERHELGRAEAELSGDLRVLQAVEARDPGPADPGVPAPAVCPYPGLATFGTAHAPYFFGRERLVAELIARLVGAPLLAVVGPSGSGKSSVIRAGLLPALAAGALPGSDRWEQLVMRPGARPAAELDHLSPGDGGDRVVLVVDQFEETFTACRDGAERARFLDALAELAADVGRGVVPVLAIRADFYGRCAAHIRLARLLAAHQVLVGPMDRDELARAVELPARRVGLEVEPRLTAALVEDVHGEAGGLPLLSAGLVELWRARDATGLHHAAYLESGGVRGAVARLAEASYAALDDGQRDTARRLLLRLADAGAEGASVRRRVPLSELDLGADPDAAAALERLADSRLITVDAGWVEVAHEALLREWPRLRAWLEVDAAGERLRQHLTLAARDWAAGGRDAAELYRGARLASALEWAATHGPALNALERGFLEAGRAEAERAAETRRRTVRRLRGALAGMAMLLLVALVAGAVALDQRGDARAGALRADAQRLGAQAVTEERLDRAMRLAATGVALDDTPVTRGNLLAALLRHPPAALGVLRGEDDAEIWGLAVSPDGRRAALGDAGGIVTLYDVGTRRRLARYSMGVGEVQRLAFSPDGRTLAVGGHLFEDWPDARVEILDGTSLRRRVRVDLPRSPPRAEMVTAHVAFAGPRDLLVLQQADGPPALSRVDVASGRIVRGPTRVGEGRASGLHVAGGGRAFVTGSGDGVTYEIDPEDLEMVRRWPAGGGAGAVDRDGVRFALGEDDGTVRMLDLRTSEVRRLGRPHRTEVTQLVFTPDGRTLVSSDAAGLVVVWDADRGRVRERLTGHAAGVWGLGVAPDGQTLFTGSEDASAYVWDLSGSRRLVRAFSVGAEFEVPQTPRGIAVSPDGETLATTHSDGSVVLVDTETLRIRDRLPFLAGAALSVDFRADGRQLAVTGSHGAVLVVDLRTRRVVRRLKGLTAGSQALAFAPRGATVAAAQIPRERSTAPVGRVLAWNAATGAEIGRLGDAPGANVAFSADGSMLAIAAIAAGTEVRTVPTGRLVARLEGGKFARSVAFSPDGRTLAVGDYAGRVTLVSTRGWRPVSRPLEAHSSRVTFVEFSPDGRALATAGADGAVALWDVAGRLLLGTRVSLGSETFASVAFDPDGTRLFAVAATGRGVVLNAVPADWRRHACLLAGSEFTAQEWAEALPGRPQQQVCGR